MRGGGGGGGAGGGGCVGGGQAGTPFHLMLLLEEQCTVLGWITLLRPNCNECTETEKPAPLWLSGGDGSYSNGVVVVVVVILHPTRIV